MTERYDRVAAAHYAAYRPPLHSVALGRALGRGEEFGVGLDVGCGTGRSSVALAERCRLVYALDPSFDMLRRAAAHPRVRYLRGTAERLPLATGSCDVVTFAGSLFYADVGAAAAEVARVGRGGIAVVYDFQVLLGEYLTALGCGRDTTSSYDPLVNLRGTPRLEELAIGSERLRLPVGTPQLAHLLLADSHVCDDLARKLGVPDPFTAVVARLGSAGEQVTREADVYFAKYRVA
ncbi:MAG: class I SAM-dependent methyltransferase [Gemmatimonadetes bacterium]|nr:class I SAM-dependent methyltransferase [Gemmatimonadota bacterium]